MFYDHLILQRNGKFALLWSVALQRPKPNVKRAEYLSLDIKKKGDELLKYIASTSSQVNRRFALRLSVQLIYGLVYIYYQQLDFLLERVKDLLNQALKAGKKPRKKISVNELEAQQQERLDQNLQENLQRAIENLSSLPHQDFSLLLEPPSVCVNPRLITLEEDPLPLISETQDNFGNENDQRIFLQDDNSFIRADIAPEDVAPHPRISVQADIHPVPPEYADDFYNLLNVPDIPSTSVAPGNLDEITTIVDVQTNLNEQAQNQNVNQQMPEIMVVEEHSQEGETALHNMSLINLEQIIDIAAPRRTARPRGLIVDDVTYIPTDIFRKNIAEGEKQDREIINTLYSANFDLNLKELKFNDIDLFTTPTHRNVLSQNIQKHFHWKYVARPFPKITDEEDILNEILGIEKKKTVPATAESTPSIVSLTPGSIKKKSKTAQSRNVAPLEIINAIQEEEMEQNVIPMEIISTIPEENVEASIGLNVEMSGIQSVREMTPIPQVPQELFPEKPFSKQDQFKKEVWNRIKELWNAQLDDDIPFLTLCPPGQASRIVAAKIFGFLLELHAQQKIVIINLENSIHIGYIRKYCSQI